MSGDLMKSALDRALERADRITVPEEKLKEMKYRSQGEPLAAAFLKDPQFPLEAALQKLDAEAQKYVSKAVEAVLLQNLSLPKKEAEVARNETVLRGLSVIKKDKEGVQQAGEQLANLSNYYTQAVKQNFEHLKAEVERALAQAAQRKGVPPPRSKPNVEQTPEFQENWRQLAGKLDMEYSKALNQLKQQIDSLR